MKRFGIFFLLLATSLYGEWTIEDMMRVKGVTTVQSSPDGKQVVYEVLDHAMEWPLAEVPRNIYIAQDEKSTLLAEGGHPSFSPDGAWIAFIGINGQLWVIAPDGLGKRQVTDHVTPVTDFRWSPNSRSLAFTAADPEEEHSKVKHADQEEGREHLWTVSLTGAKRPRRLTGGDFHVGSYFFGGKFEWSPDGKEIAFSRMSHYTPNDWAESDIAKVGVRSRKVTTLTQPATIAPFYSPDGEWIAFVKADDKSWAWISDVYILNTKTNEERPLAQLGNRDVVWAGELIGWSADSSWVYILQAEGTGSEVIALAVDGIGYRRLPLKQNLVTLPRLNPSHTELTFVSESSNHPQEAFVTRLDTQIARQVSHLSEGLPLDRLPKTKVIQWKGSDGVAVEGIFTYPSNYQRGKRYPVLFELHGGPAYFFYDDFIGSLRIYPPAILAGAGYGVLRCNVRGSTGYGIPFRRALYGDWGGKDFEDLMSGVKYLVNEGIADSEALGVMGWSYGGYLAAWTITQTNAFSAASVGAGMTNLVSYTGTTDIPSFLPDYFQGEVWENFSLYLERSAIAHVDKVTTPTLFQHGEDDTRVPVSQSYELYRALKRRGIPTALEIYPNTSHAFGDPKLLLEAAKSNLAWFDKYIKKVGN